MPHIMIDYSANLDSRINIQDLCVALRDAAMATGVLPMAGLRVRAVRVDHWVIADGNPDHGFVDISVRLRAGRTLDTRKAAVASLFAAAESFCATALATSSLMLSMEMRDIDAELAPKTSSIRRYLPGDAE